MRGRNLVGKNTPLRGLAAMPHPSRLAALQAIQQRKPMACVKTPSLEEIWASDVFTLARMKNALPKEAFKGVRRVIRDGGKLNLEVADAVAQAMREIKTTYWLTIPL